MVILARFICALLLFCQDALIREMCYMGCVFGIRRKVSYLRRRRVIVMLLYFLLSIDGIPLGHITYMKRSQPPDQFSNWLRGIKGKDTHCVSFPVCERAIFHPRRQMERRCAHSGERHYIMCAKKFIAFRRNRDVCVCLPDIALSS